jgi:hypothetical protein
MAKNVLVDAGVLVALLSRRDFHYRWAQAHVPQSPPHFIPSRVMATGAQSERRGKTT